MIIIYSYLLLSKQKKNQKIISRYSILGFSYCALERNIISKLYPITRKEE